MAPKSQRSLTLEGAIARVETPAEARALLHAILSPHELDSLRNRWSAFQMLLDGGTQRSVKARLGVSIATASRAARVIQREAGIVRLLLGRR